MLTVLVNKRPFTTVNAHLGIFLTASSFVRNKSGVFSQHIQWNNEHTIYILGVKDVYTWVLDYRQKRQGKS